MGTEVVYGYPEVGRFGLAHSLMAWARCEVWCADRGCPMIAPSWAHLRIGPYLRGERDKRAYHRLFRFPRYITGLRRSWLLATLPKHEAPPSAPDVPAPSPGVRVFRNLVTLNEETYLHEIVGRQAQIRQALVEMTKSVYLPSPPLAPHVAMHVRRGDFGNCEDLRAIRAGRRNARLPIAWYRDLAMGLRQRLGFFPVRLFSDGTDNELRPILELPSVERMPGRSAVTDLLALSQATLIISSGSGFSSWGAYLGHVPRICFPGQRFVRVLGPPSALDCEPEVEQVDELSDAFIDYAQRALHSQRANA